jgi:hypothetical protein
MTDNQIYLINSTKTLSVHSLQQAHVIRYPSGLCWQNERLEGTTYNTPCYSSVFCIPFPRQARWLIYSNFPIFTNPIFQVPLIWGASRHNLLTTSIFPCKYQSNPLWTPKSNSMYDLIQIIQNLFKSRWIISIMKINERTNVISSFWVCFTLFARNSYIGLSSSHVRIVKIKQIQPKCAHPAEPYDMLEQAYQL